MIEIVRTRNTLHKRQVRSTRYDCAIWRFCSIPDIAHRHVQMLLSCTALSVSLCCPPSSRARATQMNPRLPIATKAKPVLLTPDQCRCIMHTTLSNKNFRTSQVLSESLLPGSEH